MCKVIHTDLKPENVNLCLTEQEVQEITLKGQLKSTKLEDHHEDRTQKLTDNIAKHSKSQRGRGNVEDNESARLDKQ